MEKMNNVYQAKNDARLIAAASRNDVTAVQQALQNGTNVNASNKVETTSLMEACKYGYADIARILLGALALIHDGSIVINLQLYRWPVAKDTCRASNC